MSLSHWKNALSLVLFASSSLVGGAVLADVTLVVDTIIDDATAVACLDAVPNDCSLRGAITTANGILLPEPVTVTVPSGDYLLTLVGAGEDANQTGDLDVLRSLTLEGALVLTTDVDGGGAGGLGDRLLEVHGAGTLLEVDNMTFERGVPVTDLHAVTLGPGTAAQFHQVYIETCGSLANGGGGLFVGSGASVSLDDSRVWFNAGFQGAGILVQDGSVVITDSEIRNNVAAVRGGGIAILSSLAGPVDTVWAEGSYFFNNDSAEGGGVWAGTGTELVLIDDFFETNRVTLGSSRRGGGIYSQGRVDLDGTTITRGSANAGIAIYVEETGDGNAQLDIVNSTISAASTVSGVSAIFLFGASAEFLHVTMASNTLDITAIGGDLQVTGNLFGAGCDIPGVPLLTGGTNLGLDFSCWNGVPGPGDLVVPDLLLGPLTMTGSPTPTHFPDAGSPAVDHVVGPCLPGDQRRRVRPASGCDSGAVERVPLDIFVDGFESGDTNRWSAVFP